MWHVDFLVLIATAHLMLYNFKFKHLFADANLYDICYVLLTCFVLAKSKRLLNTYFCGMQIGKFVLVIFMLYNHKKFETTGLVL